MKMTERDAKIYVKGQLEGWLQSRGIDTSRPFRCICPSHPDRHASMSYKNGRVKCFACGFSGDMFDVLEMEENLSGRDVFTRAYELFGVEVDGRKTAKAAEKVPAATKEVVLPAAEKAKAEDLSVYISACASRAGETDYFSKRGLSADVICRFGLGFDPAFLRGTGRTVWRAAIIPNGEGGYIARNTDPAADDRNRYRKAGNAVIFNSVALYEESERPVWLVEGEIDALSMETVGASCAALGSVANADKLIRILENHKTAKKIVIAMDDDEAGRKCAEKLTAAFGLMKLEYMVASNPFCGKKDANEALVCEREAFIAAIAENEERFDTVRQADEASALAEYEEKYSAYSHLDAFIGELSADTPCVPTGFDKLNTALEGGLYPGLICIGAVSSLGKTTFCLQLADSVAANGRDVLIFSLEMSRHELMAKSISRITLENVLDSKKNIALAKSARDITVAARYVAYSDDELMLIDSAIAEYREFSRNVYIVEGVGDLGVREIRAAVEEHIAKTKRTPVVIVDYLQLIAFYAERLSDKQNTDRNVMELRRIARDMRLPVIAISSFSRASYNSQASMSAFKESGGVEYSSDVLIALQYEGVGEEGFDMQTAMLQTPRRVELKVLKNRTGVCGTTLRYRFYPKNNYFYEE